MSRRRSPLGRLVWLRRIGEKSARGELGRAQIAEAEARDQLATIRAAANARVAVEDVLRPVELEALRLQGYRLREIEEAAQTAHEITQQRLRQRVGDWRTALAERDSAERLDERRRDALAITAARAAERTIDDLQITRRRRHER